MSEAAAQSNDRTGSRWRALLATLLTALALSACAPGGSGFVSPADTGSASLASISEPGKVNPDGPRKVIEKPTLADLAVAGPFGDRFLGRADAAVTVVEYASLTCPYCRKFHAEEFQAIKKKYIDSGKVKWVLREFPIGHTSGTAWTIARCAPEKVSFPLYEAYLADQASWVSLEIRPEPIFAIAQKFGMTRETFNKCLNDEQLNAGLNWVKARGRELGVTGTPTFFVGDQKLRSVMTMAEFQALVEPQLGNPQAANVVAGQPVADAENNTN